MKNRLIRFAILVLLCFAFLLVSLHSYASTISNDLKENFFRLHILANSDSIEDQELKLKVRDAIIEYMEGLHIDKYSKNEVKAILIEKLEDIKSIAENVISLEGYSYNIELEIGTFYFPTKQYGNITLPSGHYDGLKIEIGDAKGQNWWCSLFPPLCFVDVSSGIIDNENLGKLEKNLSNEEFSIITNSSKPIKLKFKVVELLSK